MRLSLFMAAALLAGQVSALHAAPIYKWVDSSGITHFSSQPPSPDVELIRTAPAPRPAEPAAPAAPAAAGQQSQQQIEEKVREEVARTEAERAEYCVRMRTSLTQLRNNPRLMVEQEQGGERRRLSEDERQGKIADAEKAISETCQ